MSNPAPERRIIVLGSTGSIGTQTLEVIEHLSALADRGESTVRYRVVGLCAGRNARLLGEQARRHPHARLALGGEGDSTPDLPQNVLRGTDAAERLVRETPCDIILAAMVGAAGLPATLAGVELGRDIALANKETLVAAGGLVVPAALRSGSKLLPVDSEHCAVWQCLGDGGVRRIEQSGNRNRSVDAGPGTCPPVSCDTSVARIVLTASGGAFRTCGFDEVYHATPEQALKHPTWSMGPKVTIDSASLTNKALEIIEAHWLFGAPGEKIDVLVHPQSIVHALVEFADGNVVAQLAPPDMRTPIQYALTYPHRPAGISRKLDWRTLSRLDFEPPDTRRFPALELAYEVIRRGGTAGAVFNAANEAAVEAFLARRIPFGRIPELSRRALDEVGTSALRSLSDALKAEYEARECVQAMLRGSPVGA